MAQDLYNARCQSYARLGGGGRARGAREEAAPPRGGLRGGRGRRPGRDPVRAARRRARWRKELLGGDLNDNEDCEEDQVSTRPFNGALYITALHLLVRCI